MSKVIHFLWLRLSRDPQIVGPDVTEIIVISVEKVCPMRQHDWMPSQHATTLLLMSKSVTALLLQAHSSSRSTISLRKLLLDIIHIDSQPLTVTSSSCSLLSSVMEFCSCGTKRSWKHAFTFLHAIKQGV